MFLSKTIYFTLTALTGLGAGSLLLWFFRNTTAVSMKVRVLGAILAAAVAVTPLLSYKTSVTILTKDDVANYELLGETDFDLSNGKKIHIPNMGPGDFIINNSTDSFVIQRYEYRISWPQKNADDLSDILILIKPMSPMAFQGSWIHYFFKDEPERIRMNITDATVTKFQLRYFLSKDWDEYYIYDGEIKYGKPDGKGTLWSDKFTKKTGIFVEGKFDF